MPLVFLSCFFLSCDSEDSIDGIDDIHYSKADYTLFELGRLEGLDEDTEWQILEAYLKKLKSGGKNVNLTINDVYVDQYYGSYCPEYIYPDTGIDDFLITGYLDPKNHTVAALKARVKGMDSDTYLRDVIIDLPWPALLRYYDKSSVLLWDKGHLYNMEDTDFGFRPWLLAGWDYRKIINRHNGLDFETDTKIREDIGKFILTKWPVEAYALINMIYLGTYNGYTALSTINGATQLALYHKIVDGVDFWFNNSPIRIFAWKEGEIYELDDLFEQGLITHEDLVEMAYFHHAGRKKNYE
jgi:hypothetical protein